MVVLALAALAILFLACVLLYMAAKSLPRQELKRRARSGRDKRAQAIYKVAAYGSSFDLLLWLVATLSALGLVLLAFSISGWLVTAIVLLDSWLFIYSRKRRTVGRWLWAIAALAAPLASGLLSFIHPLLSRLTRPKKAHQSAEHSQIFEKEDLMELLERQKLQTDNRLSEAELNLTHSALTFSDKKVSDIMVPRTKVRFVVASEPIGPLLMDELHGTELTRFPVVKEISKSTTPEIIGVLYLKDVLDHAQKGKVRDVMRPEVHYVNEDHSLRQALLAFLKNQSHLLMVKNNFEEFVGTLAIEAIIEQILGEPVEDDLGDDEQLQTMANLAAKNLPAEQSEPEVLK